MSVEEISGRKDLHGHVRHVRDKNRHIPHGKTMPLQADQLSGKTIHSPRNCMPGSGWNVSQMKTVTIDIPEERPLTVHAVRAILVDGEERMFTYYWYQSRGRFLTSEYWHKISMVLDAIRYNRTDGALVRVLAPLPKNADIDELDAQLQIFQSV